MIEWRNETRKLRELIPWDRNPRQIRQEQAVRLSESLDEFGQVQAICIEPNNEIVDGHQRRAVWAAAEKFGADYEVDVRVASRELTEREKRKLSVYLHKGAHGEWDFDALAEWGMEDELLEWGFEERDFGFLEVEEYDFSDFDEALADLEGYEDTTIKITVPAMHKDAIEEWLANGEPLTAPGMGKGVMRRCGLL